MHEGRTDMPDKDAIAADLINWHFQVEPGLVSVYRIISENEADASEPIKLVEVNTRTMATGTFDAFGFAATPDVPYRTVIAEVTPQEFVEFRNTGRFPRGWDIASAKQYSRPAA